LCFSREICFERFSEGNFSFWETRTNRSGSYPDHETRQIFFFNCLDPLGGLSVRDSSAYQFGGIEVRTPISNYGMPIKYENVLKIFIRYACGLPGILSVFMENPGFDENDLPEDLSRCYGMGERLSRSKNPYGNSGTPESATNPVVPHFPNPPDFRGHNSEKCGTGQEYTDDNRREWMRSYIAGLQRPKAGGDVVRDLAGTARGVCVSSSGDLPGQ
jgi:hypothetical protein